MRCSESDAEFEDAVESLDVFPESSSFNVEPNMNRRSRLASLRSRMRYEFGLASSNFGGSQTSFDDISQSDCTSIASWGRKLLKEASTTSPVPVAPIDSISTKAPQVAEEHQAFLPPLHPPPPPPLLPSNNPHCRPLPPPVPPRPSPPLKINAINVISLDQSSSFDENIGRGHSKSKSLDRGISLGDKIIVPSSVKASSLNRGVAGKIVNGICEEEQRINNAQGVIHQLTLSVLSTSKDSITGTNNNNSSDGSVNHSYKEILDSVPEPSTSALYTRAKNNSFSIVEEKSLASLSPNSSKAMNDTFESNDSRYQLRASVNHKRYSSCVDASKSTRVNIFKECRSVSELNRDGKRELAHMASIDPITRDVERRMSMKDHHSTMSSSGSGEGSKEDSLVSIHSGVGYAKNLVKSYGNTAQVLLRGAYQKFRSMVTPRPRCTVAEREEDEASESDAASSSVSMSTSENNLKVGNKADGPSVICRPRSLKKGPFDFAQLRVVQELNNEHTGAVWSLKFSMCGRLLATAGRDNLVRIWVLNKHLSYFTRMREKYNQGNIDNDFEKIQLQMDKKNNLSQLDDDDSSISSRKSPLDSSASAKSVSTQACSQSSGTPVFAPKPFCIYRGHTADILDLAWSPRNYFLLSSSMDNTVKLWHLTRSECLCCFQHTDFVTCIAFMPKDDRYFISGSMDGKIRLWHVPEKKVALWNEVDQVKFITAIAFIRNRFVVVGTYDGRCFFYTTDLKYHTVINVRSSRGKNSRGHKITSLAVHGNYLLVTSNDSRIRMYSIDNIELISKFKGAQIERSQIRGTFSPDGEHVICGSEDCYAYIWRVTDVSSTYSVHNNLWERIRIHNSVVTAAVFAPKPGLVLQLLCDSKGLLSPVKTSLGSNNKGLGSASQSNKSAEISTPSSFLASASAQASRVLSELRGHKSIISEVTKSKNLDSMGDVIVTADLNGSIKVLANPRHISSIS